MRGRVWALGVALALLLIPAVVRAETTDFAAEIDSQLAGINLTEWENLAAGLPQSAQAIWGGGSLRSLIRQTALGETPVGAQGFFDGIVIALKNAFSSRGILVASLLALSVLGGILQQFRSNIGTGIGDAAGFVCYAMSVIVAVYAFSDCLRTVSEAVNQAQSIMGYVFPVLMTLLASAGATATVGLFQPATALLTGSMTAVMGDVLLPAVLTLGVLAIIGNLSGHKPLTRISALIRSIIKWMTGGISTLYIGYLSLMGIAAKGADGLSIRAARFALDKFIPYVGSLVSGSVDTLLGCTLILKNALGLCSVLLMAGVLLEPLLQIATLQLAFRLSAAVMEHIGDPRLTKAVSDLADVLAYLFAITAVIGLMFALTIGLIAMAGSSLL